MSKRERGEESGKESTTQGRKKQRAQPSVQQLPVQPEEEEVDVEQVEENPIGGQESVSRNDTLAIVASSLIEDFEMSFENSFIQALPGSILVATHVLGKWAHNVKEEDLKKMSVKEIHCWAKLVSHMQQRNENADRLDDISNQLREMENRLKASQVQNMQEMEDRLTVKQVQSMQEMEDRMIAKQLQSMKETENRLKANQVQSMQEMENRLDQKITSLTDKVLNLVSYIRSVPEI